MVDVGRDAERLADVLADGRDRPATDRMGGGEHDTAVHQVAHALDESSRVHGWVKNARLDFTIPYEHQGRKHDFIPDFVVSMRDAAGAPSDEHLVVEVKGLEREVDRSKDVGAQRWIAAVNHWGKLGRWRYVKIHSPHDLDSVLGQSPNS